MNIYTALRLRLYPALARSKDHDIAACCMGQVRDYRGSNRWKRSNARRKQEILQKELEEKYGIPATKKFNVNEWLKRNYFKELEAFQHRLGILFSNKATLVEALTHISFIKELDLIGKDNIKEDDNDDLKTRFSIREILSGDGSSSKMALVGYSLVDEVLREVVYRKYQNITPHLCSDIVKHFTKRETINVIANNLAIIELMLMSKEFEEIVDIDTEKHLNFSKEDIVCDVFYAFIGAVAKDLGNDVAVSFIKDILGCLINHEDLSTHVHIEKPHEELQKILSIHGVSGTCRARTIVETGVGTSFPVFYVGIYCNAIKIGEGSGYSARTARLDAFKNTVFMCLENEIDFNKLKKAKKFM